MIHADADELRQTWVPVLLLSVVGTAGLRYGLELLTIPRATRSILYFLHEISWYLIVGLAAMAVLQAASGVATRKVARLVAAGLPLGVAPPLIDSWVYGSGAFVYRYLYQADPLFRMTEDGGYVGELSAIWLAILGAGCWVFWKRRSILASVLAAVGMYLMLQLLGGYGPTWLRDQFLAARPLGVDRISLQLWYILSWCTLAAVGAWCASVWRAERGWMVVTVMITVLAGLQAVAIASEQPFARLFALALVLLPLPLIATDPTDWSTRVLTRFAATVAAAALVLHVPFVGLWTMLAIVVAEALTIGRPFRYAVVTAFSTIPLVLVGQTTRIPTLSALIVALWGAAVAASVALPSECRWRETIHFALAGIAAAILFVSSPVIGGAAIATVLVLAAWRLAGQGVVQGRVVLLFVLVVDAVRRVAQA